MSVQLDDQKNMSTIVRTNSDVVDFERARDIFHVRWSETGQDSRKFKRNPSEFQWHSQRGALSNKDRSMVYKVQHAGELATRLSTSTTP